MDYTTLAEELTQLPPEELSSMLADADYALDPTPFELRTAIWQERIRRHSLECQDLECGFNPYS